MPITNLKGKVDTVVLLMLENRSFDHMLSFLSLNTAATPRRDIAGITSLTKSQYVNTSKTKPYSPWVSNDAPLTGDLPHGRLLIDMQLRGPMPAPDGLSSRPITMRGFVEAYRLQAELSSVPKKADPMSVQKDPWMMGYLAAHHMVCNQWFAPLPTDTQPNRLMSLGGYTNYDSTKARVIDQKPLIFHWLTKRKIRWRVYRSGLPFEMLIESMWDDVFDETRFRSVKRLAADVNEEAAATFPQVIFLEPALGDSPIRFGFEPNDDHPPLPIRPGQKFLYDMYTALASNPDRWAKTVMVITYDEHGGFYDHVEPIKVTAKAPPGSSWTIKTPFTTTGVRVPSIIASPLVKGGSVHDGALDHTSMLQFIAELFGDGRPYSDDVEGRRQAGIGNVSDALNREEPRKRVPAPPPEPVQVMAMTEADARAFRNAPPPDKNANQKAFEDAARRVLKERRPEVIRNYPELIHWEKTP